MSTPFRCPQCGQPLVSQGIALWSRCPSCGAPLLPEPKPMPLWELPFAAGFVAWIWLWDGLVTWWIRRR